MAKQQTPTVASILPEFHGETDDWNVYREILDEFYRANGISGDDRVPVLISVIGKATYGTLRSLCHPAAPRSMRYEELCAVLARQFIPEIAIFRHRAQFYRAEQQRGESVKEWYARLKALSIECKFEEALLEPLLIDRFVVGLVPGPVQNRLYEEQPEQLRSIEKAVDLAATKESELRQATEGEAMAHEFACLAIGDEMRHGRRHARMHGKHSHRFGRPSKDERHGHRRHHGRHRGRHHHHRHHPSDYESGPEHHHHPFHPFGHHHHQLHHHGGPVRHFGPPAFGPGPWDGHHRRELAAHQYGPWSMGARMGRPGGGPGCPAMMEGFGRPGRPCGKWRKRHHHRRSSSTSSSSSSSSGSSTSSSSSSSSGSSDSEAPNEQTNGAVETQRLCRKMRRGIEGKHQGKQRHSGKRHGHGRHHHHHKHHHHDQPHGKGGRRNRKHQQEELIVSQQPERSTPPTDPTTDPELIE